MTLSRLLVATLLLVLGLATLNAQSVQWQRLAGPEGGLVRSMTIGPDGVLFATLDNHGLYSSNDDGATWSHLPLQVPSEWSAMVHSTSSGALLLIMPDSTMLRSTDEGATWSPQKLALYPTINPVNDSSGGVIAAGLHTLYRSTDEGATWNVLGTPINEEYNELAVGADGRLVAAVEKSFSPRGVRVSTDLGATWSQAQLGDSTTPTVMALGATRGGSLYAGTGGGGLFRSDDGGMTWTDVSVEPFYWYTGFVLPADGSVIVATSSGVFRSTDGGNNWQIVGNPDIRQQLSSLMQASDGTLLAGTYNSGVYASDGIRWRPSSRGLPPTGVGVLAASSDRMIYTVTSSGRFLSSSDDGATWAEPDYSRYFPSVVAVDADGRIYGASFRYPTFGMMYSTDHGATWTNSDTVIAKEMVLGMLVGRHGDIYAGVERGPYTYFHSETDGLFHSTDRGVTWTTLGTGLTGISSHSIVELGDGTLFVGSQYDPQVMRLLPGDTLWRDMSTGLPPKSPHYTLNAMIADKADNLYVGTQQGLFRSSDRGATWQRIGLNIADTSITALVMSSKGRIFASTVLHGVYSSDDNGASWQYLGDAPGVTGFDALAVDSSAVLIAANYSSGIYRAVSTSSVAPGGDAIEAGLVVQPNPVGATASIEFRMPESGVARLAIYSSIGQQMAVISQGEFSRGAHRIGLDCSGYAPGSYHLQLETPHGSTRIGLIIVR